MVSTLRVHSRASTCQHLANAANSWYTTLTMLQFQYALSYVWGERQLNTILDMSNYVEMRETGNH